MIPMRTIIAKFGGTSVSTRPTWDNILKISKNHIQNGLKPVLVCSAMSQASNRLEKLIEQALKDTFNDLLQEFIHLHQQLLQTLELDIQLLDNEINTLHQWLTGITLLQHVPAKTHAQILSLGEIMSTKAGYAFLESSGLKCMWYDARLAIKTNAHSADEFANYCQARCLPKTNTQLQKEFIESPYDLIITQGFIGANEKNETVLLGRGGSDTSAALFAAILNAKKCEIWTDVPGIYTANPHQLPQARLLKQLNYDEAQEISSQGAKVLHPMAISPVRQAKIPMAIKYTWNPEHPGTLISLDSDIDAPPVKSIQIKNSITVVAIDTSTMWEEAGFLADIFTIFRKHHFSINLISTSECNVTISLDGQGHERDKLQALLAALNTFCKAKLIEPCSSISLIGHHIRRILPELGSTFELFNHQQVHLMSLASNDLSLNIIVDESKAGKILQQLHQLLIDNNPQSYYYSKSFQEEFNPIPEASKPWWQEHKHKLIDFGKQYAPCYAYHPPVLMEKIVELKKIKSVHTLFYAIKANPNRELLTLIEKTGLSFECVSQYEIEHILELFPDMDRHRILFTPNFAHQSEYAYALAQGVHVTIDSLYPLVHWRELLQGQSIFLRIDPGIGAGHHKYVSTSGDESKFGLNLLDIDEAKHLIDSHQINVLGLHAHAGSGILSPQLWVDTAKLLLSFKELFPLAKILNLGGGLGTPDMPGQLPLNLTELDDALAEFLAPYPDIQIWLEPGRFLVSECGVILARATQEKTKNKVRFVGIDVGMNSLIRPALYGSYHHIANLSRLNEPNLSYAHVVGPICESSDTLGYDRLLPASKENDIFLIANTGAYGYCMSSQYNLRLPPPEYIFEV